MPMDAAADPQRAYRSALGCFATGVAVVSVAHGGSIIGLTVNSFTSVSLSPPLLLWCLDEGADRYAAFAAASVFGVSVLGGDQQALSHRFAGAGPIALGPDEAEIGAEGAPLLARALARFACRAVERRVWGDHLVILGETLTFDSAAGDGLTYFRGRYGRAISPEG